jgi:hypothetical protein
MVKLLVDFNLEELTGHNKVAIVLGVIPALCGGFVAITFIQSSLDKIFNYKDNLSWLKGQFSKTFLAKTVPLLLPVLTLGELSSGLVAAYGIIQLLLSHRIDALISGLAMAGLVVLMLLFGQRVSKEYAGAASLTGYFLVVIAGLLSCFFASSYF